MHFILATACCKLIFIAT